MASTVSATKPLNEILSIVPNYSGSTNKELRRLLSDIRWVIFKGYPLGSNIVDRYFEDAYWVGQERVVVGVKLSNKSNLIDGVRGKLICLTDDSGGYEGVIEESDNFADNPAVLIYLNKYPTLILDYPRTSAKVFLIEIYTVRMFSLRCCSREVRHDWLLVLNDLGILKSAEIIRFGSEYRTTRLGELVFTARFNPREQENPYVPKVVRAYKEGIYEGAQISLDTFFNNGVVPTGEIPRMTVEPEPSVKPSSSKTSPDRHKLKEQLRKDYKQLKGPMGESTTYPTSTTVVNEPTEVIGLALASNQARSNRNVNSSNPFIAAAAQSRRIRQQLPQLNRSGRGSRR